jgi:hypothetical protein
MHVHLGQDILLGWLLPYPGPGIHPNPTLYRIRPNPTFILIGSKCPHRLQNTPQNHPVGCSGFTRIHHVPTLHQDDRGFLLRAAAQYGGGTLGQSDRIFHIEMGDDRIDTVISHIISPHSTSISRMTISICYIPYPLSHIDDPIAIS